MFAWIAENAVTIVVIAVLLVIVGLAVFYLVKKKSSCSCFGNCAACKAGCSCNKDEL